MNISYAPIGTIHTPFTKPEGMPIQPSGAKAIQGTIILKPQYEPGLRDLDGFSHIILLYHFHLAKGFRLTVTPFLDTAARGLFSTRSPRRPNPIGLSIVSLLHIDGLRLHVQEVDIVDGTPLLDIKPWVPAFDVRENARVGWLADKQQGCQSVTADRRFAEDERKG